MDNNLWLDRTAGSKALDPYYDIQPTLSLHDLCLEVLTLNGTELRLFVAKAFPPTHTIWAEHRTHHLPNAEQIRYVLGHRRGSKNKERDEEKV